MFCIQRWNFEGIYLIKIFILEKKNKESFSNAMLFFKVWKKPKLQEDDEKEEVTELQTLRTVLAHDQEINGLSASHDGEMAATASQDKTCKIWRIKDMALLTTLTGHRRGMYIPHIL